MRLTHAVPRIDQEAAGPSYSVPRLCQALAARGHAVDLVCIAARGDIPGVRLALHKEWPVLRRFEVSTSAARTLSRRAAEVDIVHNHSLWSMVNVACGLVVPGRHAKLVTSPRGTLSPWALRRSRNLKALLKPLQWRALERADLLHATSDMELAEIRVLNLSAPVAVVPNGIDIPGPMAAETPAGLRTLLFLSRIHPKKGIERLLRAWQVLQRSHAEWRLSIVGRGEPHDVEQVKALANALTLERVDFPGPMYGKERTAAYRSADLFVLPSHSENFGMVVAEALAHGRPVVASKGTPWQDLEREACGWWVDHDVESLAAALDRAMQLPRSELLQWGERGRRWMQRDFSWESVAKKLEAAYGWVLRGSGEPPPCVRIG
jgi:glycosyltransferase involved in cell wall biosynthesis